MLLNAIFPPYLNSSNKISNLSHYSYVGRKHEVPDYTGWRFCPLSLQICVTEFQYCVHSRSRSAGRLGNNPCWGYTPIVCLQGKAVLWSVALPLCLPFGTHASWAVSSRTAPLLLSAAARTQSTEEELSNCTLMLLKLSFITHCSSAWDLP